MKNKWSDRLFRALKNRLFCSVIFASFLSLSLSLTAETPTNHTESPHAAEAAAPSFSSLIKAPDWKSVILLKRYSWSGKSDEVKIRTNAEYSQFIKKLLHLYACQSMGYLDKFGQENIPFAYRNLLNDIAQTKHSSLVRGRRSEEAYKSLVWGTIIPFVIEFGGNKRDIWDDPIFEKLHELLIGSSEDIWRGHGGLISKIKGTPYKKPVVGLSSYDYTKNYSSFKKLLDSTQSDQMKNFFAPKKEQSLVPGQENDDYCQDLAIKEMKASGVKFADPAELPPKPEKAKPQEPKQKDPKAEMEEAPPAEENKEEEQMPATPDAPKTEPADPQMPPASADTTPPHQGEMTPEDTAEKTPPPKEMPPPPNVGKRIPPPPIPDDADSPNASTPEEMENPEPAKEEDHSEGMEGKEPASEEELVEEGPPLKDQKPLRDQIATTLKNHQWGDAAPYQVGTDSVSIDKIRVRKEYNHRINRSLGCPTFSTAAFHAARKLARVTRRNNKISLAQINEATDRDLNAVLKDSQLSAAEKAEMSQALKHLNKVTWETIFEENIEDSDTLASYAAKPEDSKTIDKYFEKLLTSDDADLLNRDPLLRAIDRVNSLVQKIGADKVPCSEDYNETAEILAVNPVFSFKLGKRGQMMVNILDNVTRWNGPGFCLMDVRKAAKSAGYPKMSDSDYLYKNKKDKDGDALNQRRAAWAKNSDISLFHDRSLFADITEWALDLQGTTDPNKISVATLKNLPIGSLIIYETPGVPGHIEQVVPTGFASDFKRPNPWNQYKPARKVKTILFPLG